MVAVITVGDVSQQMLNSDFYQPDSAGYPGRAGKLTYETVAPHVPVRTKNRPHFAV